ncbi:hypothetical protein ACBZ91_13330 [Vibrio natriegens]|uniref:hypothetical protein n=1 Tax=Vibrio natriegens TaxID=691 RepID=UPI00355793E4
MNKKVKNLLKAKEKQEVGVKLSDEELLHVSGGYQHQDHQDHQDHQEHVDYCDVVDCDGSFRF